MRKLCPLSKLLPGVGLVSPSSVQLPALGPMFPGEFNKKRLEFIKRVRSDESTTFKEASARWMTSQDRVDLLAGMPWSELKKRRFL